MKSSEKGQGSGVYVTVATHCSSSWKTEFEVAMTTEATMSPLFPAPPFFFFSPS